MRLDKIICWRLEGFDKWKKYALCQVSQICAVGVTTFKMKTLGLIKIGLAVVALVGVAHGGDITDITCDCGKNSWEL